MYKLCFGFVLSALTLVGQTIDQPIDQVNPPSTARPVYPPLAKSFGEAITKMHSVLMAMKAPGTTGDLLTLQLTSSMLAVALPERQPTASDVTAFAVELASALNGRIFSDEQGTNLQQCLVDVIRAQNVSNFELARRLRDTLVSLGITDLRADPVVRRFLAIGEAVRGPDDRGLAPKFPKLAPTFPK